MSMYQQPLPSHYGHHAYPSHQPLYPPPQPSTYGYQQPPPFAFDPSSFRREYVTRLAELTVNSRPIIHNLSMMAQNFTRYSDIVAECLQAHIRRVPPWMKLPAFYVLDAISKNVYDPYAAKFSAFVVPLFLEAYGQVDGTTRSKMEEMLVTWRTGSPSGKELFGIAAQVSLERQIWGRDPSNVETKSRRNGQQAQLTSSQVLTELDVVLARKDQVAQSNPYDQVAPQQVSALHQLRRMVEQGVSQVELHQILVQLREMGRETALAVPPRPAPVPTPVAGPALPQNVSLGQHTTSHGSVLKDTEEPNASSSTSPSISGISNLFESLVKAGLVSSSSTPRGAGMSAETSLSVPVSQEDNDAKAVQRAEDDRLESQRSYARDILKLPIRLSTAEITRQRPKNVSLLYDRMTVQCRQCAARFTNDTHGKRCMQNHLDSHFRQNRRAKELAGKGQSRSWFISIEDFISEHPNLKGKGRATDLEDEDASKREAELRASILVVPPGDEAKTINCPVCKEMLKSEFQEDEEEWVWRNAVQVKDKIYHATCHAEMAASATLASKLRDDSGSVSSRSRTPDAPSTPSKNGLRLPKVMTPEPAPATNLARKRKAEDVNPGLDGRPLDETPPMKKVVLSTA